MREFAALFSNYVFSTFITFTLLAPSRDWAYNFCLSALHRALNGNGIPRKNLVEVTALTVYGNTAYQHPFHPRKLLPYTWAIKFASIYLRLFEVSFYYFRFTLRHRIQFIILHLKSMK